ncbi:hypothetical protein, partial [Planotetraspora phitsanulokensis]
KLLNFWPDLDDLDATAKVSTAGTIRRVQALAVAGYSRTYIADRLGIQARWFQTVLYRDTMTARIARAVRDLYPELRGQQPPSSTKPERIVMERTMQRAAREEWEPFEAWDDDTIDDPRTKPWEHIRCHLDECGRSSVSSNRLCSYHERYFKERGTLDGIRPKRNGAALIEEATFIVKTDRLVTRNEVIDRALVAARLLVTEDALERALNRANVTLTGLKESA